MNCFLSVYFNFSFIFYYWKKKTLSFEMKCKTIDYTWLKSPRLQAQSIEGRITSTEIAHGEYAERERVNTTEQKKSTTPQLVKEKRGDAIGV